MNDFIDVKIAFSNYLHNIADLIYRFINNSSLKKVLIFPLFFILLVLEIAIFPIALLGAIAKWIVYFVVSVSDDRAPMFYTLFVIFIELFLLYYIVFVILLFFYWIFGLMSNGLGKANNEYNADEFITQYEYKNSVQNDNVDSEKNEKNNDEVYVINTDEYK